MSVSSGGPASPGYRAAAYVIMAGRAAFVAGAMAVTVLCLLPASTLPPVQLWDKLEHFIAYGLLAAAGGIGYPEWRSRTRIVLFLLALGVAIEFAQGSVPGRESNALDMLANTFGVVIGIATAALFSRVMGRQQPAGS